MFDYFKRISSSEFYRIYHEPLLIVGMPGALGLSALAALSGVGLATVLPFSIAAAIIATLHFKAPSKTAYRLNRTANDLYLDLSCAGNKNPELKATLTQVCFDLALIQQRGKSKHKDAFAEACLAGVKIHELLLTVNLAQEFINKTKPGCNLEKISTLKGTIEDLHNKIEAGASVIKGIKDKAEGVKDDAYLLSQKLEEAAAVDFGNDPSEEITYLRQGYQALDRASGIAPDQVTLGKRNV